MTMLTLGLDETTAFHFTDICEEEPWSFVAQGRRRPHVVDTDDRLSE